MPRHFRLLMAAGVLPLLLILLTACRSAQTPIPVNTTLLPTEQATATRTFTATPSPLPPTATPRPTKTPPPTATLTPTPELLACPLEQPSNSGPIQILYTKQNTVWLWDETSGEKTQVALPEEADAPVISQDGQLIAFTIRGKSVDTPNSAGQAIPLWLHDRESGQSMQVATFETEKVRALYPKAPRIFLQLEWLADTHRLLVQVYPEPWESGYLQPTGDLYLVDADRGSNNFILPAGSFERISVRPDGGQLAALDTPAFDEAGNVNFDLFPDGQFMLIDAQNGTVNHRLPARLYADPWAMIPPAYSPDGKYAAWNSESGFAVINTETGALQEIPMQNTCQPEACYWTDHLPVYWKPDSRSFYTLTAMNDFFDERAETTLHEVFIEPSPSVERLKVIHAHTWSFFFSPDRRTVSYWNQPDPDKLDAGTAQEPGNFITFYLMDMEQLEPRRYMAEFSLRNLGWHPNNRQFLYAFSDKGGANQLMNQVSIGDVCHPPHAILLPQNGIYQRARWIDENRFLLWGGPNPFTSNGTGEWLYLFWLDSKKEPAMIDNLAGGESDDLLYKKQIVVIRK